MKFDWEKTINGIRLIVLRDFLRKNFPYSTSDGITSQGVFRRIRAGTKTARGNVRSKHKSVLRDDSLLLPRLSLHVHPHPRAIGTLAPLAHSRR
jgi:hypothetical protein